MRLKRGVFVACGTVALALGIVGIFVPLLPTTPFLLLASWCYVRGSRRLHGWLLGQRHLGPYIRAFEEGRGIPPRVKAVAIATLWASMALTIALVEAPVVRIALVATGALVTVWLLRQPSCSNSPLWTTPRTGPSPEPTTSSRCSSRAP